MAEKEPKSKEFHGVPVHRSIVAAIAQETGASVTRIIEELAATFTPGVFIMVRNKLRPAAGALEAALGEPVSVAGGTGPHLPSLGEKPGGA